MLSEPLLRKAERLIGVKRYCEDHRARAHRSRLLDGRAVVDSSWSRVEADHLRARSTRGLLLGKSRHQRANRIALKGWVVVSLASNDLFEQIAQVSLGVLWRGRQPARNKTILRSLDHSAATAQFPGRYAAGVWLHRLAATVILGAWSGTHDSPKSSQDDRAKRILATTRQWKCKR